MTNDPASLDRLHDIVVTDPVPFWPPAPGWYVVIALVLVAAGWFAVWAVRRYRRNAYRRAALVELEAVASVSDAAVLLKRVALSAYPRHQVARLTGEDWLRWLAATSGLNIAPAVARALTHDLYAADSQTRDLDAVTGFVRDWIRRHGSVVEEGKGGRSC